MSEPLGWTPETALVELLKSSLAHMSKLMEVNQTHTLKLMESNQLRTEERLLGLRTLMDERDKRWPTRDEIREEFNVLEKKIADLQETRSEGHGERAGLTEKRTNLREDRRLLFTGAAFVVALVSILMQIFL